MMEDVHNTTSVHTDTIASLSSMPSGFVGSPSANPPQSRFLRRLELVLCLELRHERLCHLLVPFRRWISRYRRCDAQVGWSARPDQDTQFRKTISLDGCLQHTRATWYTVDLTHLEPCWMSQAQPRRSARLELSWVVQNK